MSLCLLAKKSFPLINNVSCEEFISERDILKRVGVFFNSSLWLPTNVSNRCIVSADSGVASFLASSKFASVIFSTKATAIFSGAK